VKFKDLFYLNRSDRMLVIFFTMVLVVVCGLMAYLGRNETIVGPSSSDSLPDSTYVRRHPSRSDYGSGEAGGYYRQDAARQVERFPFDPNTADSTQLLRLGLRPWQVRSIYRYRAAGGIYRQPSDFARLYGLTQKEYRELEPYIRIAPDYQPAADRYGTSRSSRRDSLGPDYPTKLQLSETIDLNAADTTLLMRVPGIGRYFAREIAAYRQRLGGFYSVDQLLEIEEFPEKALPYFVVHGTTTKIAVNRLTLNQLKRHPYINYYQAKAIVDYRRLRGPLKSLGDLRLHKDFSEKDMERLSHYVEF
jgi:DNA uptake protein ComE-like DNA-binding protein